MSFVEGLVYGAVLGDTLGVATELLPKEEIEFYYGSGRLEHAAMVNDEHRSHFRRGKTTCVSDLMVCINRIDFSNVIINLFLALNIRLRHSVVRCAGRTGDCPPPS